MYFLLLRMMCGALNFELNLPLDSGRKALIVRDDVYDRPSTPQTSWSFSASLQVMTFSLSVARFADDCVDREQFVILTRPGRALAG